MWPRPQDGIFATGIGHYTDTLRALSRYFSQIGATQIAIIEEPRDLGLVWRARDGRQRARAFGAGELWTLRASARLYRGTHASDPQGPSRMSRFRLTPRPADPLEVQLRGLGAMADCWDVSGIAIAETRAGYHVSARQQGRRFSVTIASSELIIRANQAYRYRTDPAQ